MNGDDYTKEGAAEMRDELAKAEGEGLPAATCSALVHMTPEEMLMAMGASRDEVEAWMIEESVDQQRFNEIYGFRNA